MMTGGTWPPHLHTQVPVSFANNKTVFNSARFVPLAAMGRDDCNQQRPHLHIVGRGEMLRWACEGLIRRASVQHIAPCSFA